MKLAFLHLAFGSVLCFVACNSAPKPEEPANDLQSAVDVVELPEPFATKSVNNFSKVTGWPAEKTPFAPEGFTVKKFAGDLMNPRMIYVAKNGDIFVAESNTEVKGVKKVAAEISGKAKSMKTGNSANQIRLLRDKDGDGVAESSAVFLAGLNQPFGMLILDGHFYVANTDGIVRYPYKEGDSVISAKGTTIASLPAGGYNNHWTRNLISNADGSKIYVSVGSASNVAEHGMNEEERRAAILEMNPDGSGEKIYASGLRNPVGMDWAPGTNTLWTAVNERDGLGDELVPDYLAGVQPGGFYGWPWLYFGDKVDPRLEEEAKTLNKTALVPDVALGSHTASLGLAFYKAGNFPEKYKNGAFIGQHGSWNRSQLSGYKVVFVPFSNGKPSGNPEDFLTGFIGDASQSEVYGRPVGVAVSANGGLLVADDAGNTIWHVSKQ